MYCRKCGKWIEGDATICPECQEAETKARNEADSAPKSATAQNTTAYTAPPSAPAQPVAQQQTNADPTNSVMYGFGKALTSTILGAVGYIFACIGYNGLRLGNTGIPLLVAMLIVCIPCFIIAIIFGPKSIKTFIIQKNAGKKKPIPALVLGIVGTVGAGLTALYFLIGIILVAIIV